MIKYTALLSILFLLTCTGTNEPEQVTQTLPHEQEDIIHLRSDPAAVRFYFKDEQGQRIKSLGKLVDYAAVQGDSLIFATNGGMFDKKFNPVGLYVENGRQIKRLDRKAKGYGNFYLQPNGVFTIDENNLASIVTTDQYVASPETKYATQSGPMLLVDGAFHPAFNEGSKNLNIRNGVGLLPNGDLLFAMSKDKINFYDFANFFRENGCRNALYLDGYVSQTYAPTLGQLDKGGDFGVMIGVVK